MSGTRVRLCLFRAAAAPCAELSVRGVPQSEVEAAEQGFDAEMLTIGFARVSRRTAGSLILRIADRLSRILNDPTRPGVGIFWPVKAHPATMPEKR